jgi:isopropylmalate/homocitrate/citramalate synthase
MTQENGALSMAREPADAHTQRERFEQVARELGVELDEEKLKEALRKIATENEKSKSGDR